MLYLNCQGLAGDKSDLLFAGCIERTGADFVCLAETWLCQAEDGVVHFDGFNRVAEFCRRDSIRGGVAIWSRRGLVVRSLDLSPMCTEKIFEVCGVTWDSHNGPRYMFTCYRSNRFMDLDHMLRKIAEILDAVYKPSCKIIFMGDFNLDPLRDRKGYNSLCDLMTGYGLCNIVDKPTRGEYTLDHVFTSDSQSCIIEDTPGSDHRSVLFGTTCPEVAAQNFSFTRRSFSLETRASFARCLLQESWRSMYEASDASVAFECFQRVFAFHFDQNFPLKVFHSSHNKHTWVTDKVRESSKNLKNLFYLCKLDPGTSNRYKKAKHQHSLLVGSTKREFYQKKINDSGNPIGGAWAVVGDLTGKKSKHNNNMSIVINGERVDDPGAVAECFNSFFVDAPLEIIKQIPSVRAGVRGGVPCSHSLFLEPFVELEFLRLMEKRLKPKKSAGYDDCPGFLMRDVVWAIATPLVYLVNLSFETGRFPERLKLSKVIPVYKNKGEEQLPENYRPIALTSIFSKVFEYCFLDRLERFVNKYSLINPQQFGFRSNVSTQDAVGHFLQGVIERVDAGECPVGILCDLSRAFDCVDHSKLLNKLERCGIRGRPLSWVRTFLQGRRQYVSVTCLSAGRREWSRSSCVGNGIGVPQGTVLAPILFILYINDMVDSLQPECRLTLYADDTTLLISGKDDEAVQSGCDSSLSGLLEWYSDNSLFLNISKTKYIRFHSYQKKCDTLNIAIDNIQIQMAENAKFLGVHIDSHLSWSCHCSGLVSKLHSYGYLFRNLRGVLDMVQLRSLYIAFVESRLRYGICFWGAGSDIRDVLVAQKRVVRCLAGLRTAESCRSAFKSLKILTVPGLYILELCLYIYRNQHKFLLNRDVHDFDTRFRNELRPEPCRLNIKKYSREVYGLKIFNKLPSNIKNSKTVTLFSRNLRAFLAAQALYSTGEFFDLVGGEFRRTGS